MKRKVIVGMSGGVDSSVTAVLLKEKGYEVIGITMNTWEGFSSAEDAKTVSNQIGIEHHIMDFQNSFRTNVQDYFCKEYLAGSTPNPCVICNREVKFQALTQAASVFGADYIATGHYAHIIKLENGRYSIKASQGGKDQTYALYRLSQEQLSKVIMPLGDYSKHQVREIAKKAGLFLANKSDSQEICFIPDNNYTGYIEKRTNSTSEPGNFIDKNGNILGLHKGIIHYTIGQRKGLGLSLGRPIFVIQILPKTNEVVLGDSEDLFKNELMATQLNFMGIENLPEEMNVVTKIRYSHPGAPSTIIKTGPDEILCRFNEPQRAITPGQSAVFYKDDIIIGGGIII